MPGDERPDTYTHNRVIRGRAEVRIKENFVIRSTNSTMKREIHMNIILLQSLGTSRNFQVVEMKHKFFESLIFFSFLSATLCRCDNLMSHHCFDIEVTAILFLQGFVILFFTFIVIIKREKGPSCINLCNLAGLLTEMANKEVGIKCNFL